MSDHTHVVHNGKRELTIDELARQSPGLDRLMAEVGPRMHRLFYAGQAGNWEAAAYFYRSTVKQLAACAQSRPKYEPAISRYVEQDCRPVQDVIEARDADGFPAAYARMVARANDYHDAFGKGFLVWRCPSAPPDDLDFSPRTR